MLVTLLRGLPQKVPLDFLGTPVIKLVLAEMNSAKTKVLPIGQNACTALPRRPTLWGPRRGR